MPGLEAASSLPNVPTRIFLENIKCALELCWQIKWSPIITACSSCYSKILHTWWLINHSNLFLTVLEVEELKNRKWPIRCLLRLHSGSQIQPSSPALLWWSGRTFLGPLIWGYWCHSWEFCPSNLTYLKGTHTWLCMHMLLKSQCSSSAIKIHPCKWLHTLHIWWSIRLNNYSVYECQDFQDLIFLSSLLVQNTSTTKIFSWNVFRSC